MIAETFNTKMYEKKVSLLLLGGTLTIAVNFNSLCVKWNYIEFE